MSIRLRKTEIGLVALCAAKSIAKPGDVYLDDDVHHALATKFSLDFTYEGWGDIPFDPEEAAVIEREESNNPNRERWDKEHGGVL